MTRILCNPGGRVSMRVHHGTWILASKDGWVHTLGTLRRRRTCIVLLRHRKEVLRVYLLYRDDESEA